MDSGIEYQHAVELLPPLSHAQMAEVFRRAQIVASPSIHDGTPNTLLEGIACGCFPVAGDLESIREWITPNENGLLFDSNRSAIHCRCNSDCAGKQKPAGQSRRLKSKDDRRSRGIQAQYAEGGRVLRKGQCVTI